MKVKNRKTGNEYILNKEDWDKLVAQKLSRLFTIIDETDDAKQRIDIPKSIIDYRIEYKPTDKTPPKKPVVKEKVIKTAIPTFGETITTTSEKETKK